MSFPNVSDAFWDWTQTVRFQVLDTTIADFEVDERPISVVAFNAVLEPLTPQALLVKPENQRRWIWWNLWTSYALNPGQLIQDPQGFQYRIMAKSNWSNGGYVGYEAVQAPAVNTPPPVEG